MGSINMRPWVPALLFFVISIAGCSTAVAPNNLSELLNNRPAKKYCYRVSSDEITPRVRSFFSSCFQDSEKTILLPFGGAFMPLTSKFSWTIEEEVIAKGTRFVVLSGDKKLFIASAEVEEGELDNCTTQLTTYSGNLGFQIHFPDSIYNYAGGLSTECPSNLK